MGYAYLLGCCARTGLASRLVKELRNKIQDNAGILYLMNEEEKHRQGPDSIQ